jgi:polysaccharide biosynthesis protein PslG
MWPGVVGLVGGWWWGVELGAMRKTSRLVLTVLLASMFLLLASVAVSFASAAQFGGVNVHSLWDNETTAQMDAELDLAAGAHVTVLRVDVGWSAFEGDGPGQFSAPRVAKLDYFMAGAASRGIKVLPVVFSTPCWASSAPASELQGCAGDWWDRGVTAYPPSDPQTYGNFLQWMTSRYGADMAGVEVWNEPNEISSWQSSDPAGDYAKLLKAGYAGAKAGDLNVPVIAGAIAGANVDFLNQLYADGIQGHYDGLSIHTYSGAQSPMFDPGSEGLQATVLPGIQAIHGAQLAAGDNTPLWITELGWQTQPGLYQAVSDQQQASYITTAFRAIQQLSYVRAAVVYDLRDGPDPTNYMDHYGLVTDTFAPKPGLAALTAVLANPATPTDPPTSTTGQGATATVARTAGSALRRVSSKLGKLRAGNIFDRATRLNRVGVWQIGGPVHVLAVTAQKRPFAMLLTKPRHGSLELVFARCTTTTKQRPCALRAAHLTPTGQIKTLTRLPASPQLSARLH